MSWQDRFTAEQLEHIKEDWKGEPPIQCKGTCKMSHFFAAGCTMCGWHEEMPTDAMDGAYDN